MKDFFIGYMKNVFYPAGKVETEPDFDDTCIHLDAVKQILGETVETLIGLQAICLVNEKNPNVDLFGSLVDAGLQAEAITPETISEFEGSNEPYIGTFATCVSKWKNHQANRQD